MVALVTFLLTVGYSIELVLSQGPVFSDGEVVGNVASNLVTEASGCAASRIYPNILYTHNDHGDSPRLFAIDATTAQVVAVLNIENANHSDWEDIAVGPCSPEENRSCIYILDDGDVHGKDARTVYKLSEPEFSESFEDQSLEPEAVFVYNWTEHEGCVLMVDPDATLYIISNVNGGRGMIVTIPPSAWDQSGPFFLQSTSFFGMESSHHDPASGDISPDGREVLVKNREEAYYYTPAGGEVVAALTKPGYQVPLAVERLGEAICWAADASAYYTLGEGTHQPLYKYTRLSGESVIG